MRCVKPNEGGSVFAGDFLHLWKSDSVEIVLAILGRALFFPVIQWLAAFVIPILGVRVIKAELNVGLVTGCLEFLNRVPPKRGRLHKVVLTRFGVKESKSIVVLAGDDDVFHPSVLGDADPLFGIKFDRIEFRGERLVFFDRDFLGAHDPFASSWLGIETPMNKHAEFILVQPIRPVLRSHFKIQGRMGVGNKR